ncbi:MAG: ATP-binding protein [Chloroflexota bacterium]
MSVDETLPITYQTIIANMPRPALVLDTRLRVVCANSLFAQYVSRELTAIVGQPIADSFASILPYLSAVETFPLRQKADVDGRYLQLDISELTTPADGVLGYLLMMQDVTPDHVVKNALRTYEQRYRALFERSHDAIFILDFERIILIANQQAADMLQIALSQLLHENFLPFVAEDDIEILETHIALLKKGAQLPLQEIELHNQEGYRVTTEISLSLVRDSDNTPIHMQAIVRDISGRKRAERKLQERIEQLDVLLLSSDVVNQNLDMEHVLVVAVETARFLTESDAAFISVVQGERIVVRGVSGLYPTEVIGDVIAYDWGIVGRVLVEQEPMWVRDVHSDPDYVPDIPETKSLIALPLISQERLLGILNLETANPENYTEDIFQLAQIFAGLAANTIENALLYAYVREQLYELTTLYDELQDAEMLKTDMIRIANHDLKNPLASVAGIVELMAMEQNTLPVHFAEYIDEMQQSLERANGILKDFLSIEAINQRMKSMTITRVNLHELGQRAFDEFASSAEEKRFVYTFSVDEQGTYVVEGDTAQLYEAMTNLLDNAIKYTAPGGRVAMTLGYRDDFMIRLAVEDTGFGIPKSRQKRLFEPFYRSQTKETSHIEGTGLGLHLVRNIIDRHGGEMIYKSVYRKGSTFGFLLVPALTETVG